MSIRGIDRPTPRRRFLARCAGISAGVALAGLLGACGRRSATLARLPTDAVVLAFGDSLTYGTGAGSGQNYPAQLETLIGRKVVASGIPGEVSAAGLARLPAVLDEVKPQLVILCHGGNDILRRLSESQTAENLRAMVRLAQSRGAAVVLIGVPKPGIFPSTADFYGDIADEFKAPHEGGILKKVLTDNALKSDTVHPNAAGYRKIAEAIGDLLRSAGAV
jgi:acyl-CoA thioesterase-1